jgi:hypothetical protein
MENLSLNLSPTRRETLNFPPYLVGKGVRGLGFSLAFPHDLKSQVCRGERGVFLVIGIAMSSVVSRFVGRFNVNI